MKGDNIHMLAVQLDNVTKKFNQKTVIDNLSLKLEEKRFMALPESPVVERPPS